MSTPDQGAPAMSEQIEQRFKTWADVERAALHCPVLHAAVTMVRQGTATREQALIAAALFLSDANQTWKARETDRLMREPSKRLRERQP